MYSITIENKYGEQLELTGNHRYMTKVTGLNPVKSNIITATVANYGGARYVTSRKEIRNIVLTIFVNQPVEANRINLYRYIKSDDYIKVYFKNGARHVWTEGYVETFELDHFAQTQTAQVSIICPQPELFDMTTHTVHNSDTENVFYLPFYANDTDRAVLGSLTEGSEVFIDSYSDDEIGFIYEITCSGEVENITIYHAESGERFELSGIFKLDDVITINTLRGHKSVTKTYNGVTTNIINYMVIGSKWLQLQSGYNHLTQTAERGADKMTATITYTNEYEGV